MNVRIFQINVFCTSACRYVKKYYISWTFGQKLFIVQIAFYGTYSPGIHNQ